MRILLCLSHSIEEHDQLDLLHSLGYEVASIGGYIDPAHPHDPKRPPLPRVPCYQDVKEAVDAIGSDNNLGHAQTRIPDRILEWLGDDGAIIYHHYLERLYGQWGHIRDWLAGSSGRRVIWRTVGQSVEHNEQLAVPYRADGLEIVRYSPKERILPGFAGEDALIRFWKDPDEWSGWVGDTLAVTNITQQLRARDPFTNYRFWEQATQGLPVHPAGPGSEQIGGVGELDYDAMRLHLREMRCYLYTGTQPASYTLGLIEAMMTGIPVVSIGPTWMDVFSYGPDLFEGLELAQYGGDDPDEVRAALEELLNDRECALEVSRQQRARAIEVFGRDVAEKAWLDFLGAP